MSFTDEILGKALAEYVYGSHSFEEAIKFIIQWIPENSENILDVGCKIGWVSNEIKSHFRNSKVIGIDPNAKFIDLALHLFDEPEFKNLEFANLIQNLNLRFDAVVMINPKYTERTENLPKILRDILKPISRLIMIIPTNSAEQNLESEYYPNLEEEYFQKISEEDLKKIGEEIGGKIVYLSKRSIESEKDYIYVVIQKGSIPSEKARKIILEPRNKRYQRVRTKLKVRVSPHGLVMRDYGSPRLCIFTPNINAYSETFIRAHIERMPTFVTVLYGNAVDLRSADNAEPIIPFDLLSKITRYLERKFIKPYDQNRYFATKYLKDFFRKNEIEVVLAEYGTSGVLLMDACYETRTPLVVHFHGFDASNKHVIKRYHKEYEKMFRISSYLIAVSNDMVHRLIKLGAPAEKIVYNPCGVDTQVFSGGNPLISPPILVSVGRFVEIRAPFLTILAFSKVLKECPEAKLVMIGDGELLGSCKILAESLGIKNSVYFLGALPQWQVVKLLKKSRAFVLNSVTSTSGAVEGGVSVAILEAQSVGIPVVSTRQGGINDSVVDGETGFLINEKDIDGMAQKMIILIKNPKLAYEMGQKGRKRVQELFSMEKSIQNLFDVIKKSVVK